jgi:hypothetical protein
MWLHTKDVAEGYELSRNLDADLVDQNKEKHLGLLNMLFIYMSFFPAVQFLIRLPLVIVLLGCFKCLKVDEQN